MFGRPLDFYQKGVKSSRRRIEGDNSATWRVNKLQFVKKCAVAGVGVRSTVRSAVWECNGRIIRNKKGCKVTGEVHNIPRLSEPCKCII